MKKNNTLTKIIALLLVFALNMIFVPGVKAGELENEKDVMTRVKAGTNSNHTISFTLAAENTFEAGETIVITFPAGFDLTDLVNTDPLDYDIKTDTGGTPVDEVIVAAAGCGTSNAIEITSITGQVITFTACSSYIATPAAASIEIEIGTHAALGGAGDSQIQNPTAGNDKKISISAAGDSGALAVSIIDDDQVVITATVDPTFTFTISANTCDLGTLSTSPVSTCPYNITSTGNCEDGYATTIIEDGNLRDGSNDIDDTTGNVDTGSEEYGFRTSGADGQFNSTDEPITGTAKTIALDTTGPISSQTVTVTHKASISSTTLAGSYSHIVTLISTGTF